MAGRDRRATAPSPLAFLGSRLQALERRLHRLVVPLLAIACPGDERRDPAEEAATAILHRLRQDGALCLTWREVVPPARDPQTQVGDVEGQLPSRIGADDRRSRRPPVPPVPARAPEAGTRPGLSGAPEPPASHAFGAPFAHAADVGQQAVDRLRARLDLDGNLAETHLGTTAN